MTELSYFWDGITTGDAAEAPYNSAEYSELYSRILANNVGGYGLVIPISFAQSLEVTPDSPASMTVNIAAGNALFLGRLYRNTLATTLTLDAADAANPRIDRIVLRMDRTAQTIRLAVLKGTAAAAPSKPTLTSTPSVTDVPLAYIWVAALAVSVGQGEIHDERTFAANMDEVRRHIGITNWCKNSEFMGFSAQSTVPAARASPSAPDYWENVGTPSAYSQYLVSPMTDKSRGRTVRITSDAPSEGMQQRIPVRAGAVYSVIVYCSAVLGAATVEVSTNSAAPNTITRYRRFNAYEDEVIYYQVEADATELYVRVLCLGTGDVVDVDFVSVVEGWLPGPHRPTSETIMFLHPIGDASWNNTAKSSGITTIDMDVSFQALILPGTRALIIYMRANDSGSAGSGAALTLLAEPAGTVALATIDLTNEPNDKGRDLVAMVPIYPNGNTFRVQVVATGVGTLDATLRIAGIVT